MNFRFKYIILIALLSSFDLRGQEVSKEMLDFPLNNKQVQKMTAALEKLNGKFEKQLSKLRAKITEEDLGPQVLTDTVVLDSLNMKKDSLLLKVNQLESQLDSLGIENLEENKQYQELKKQIEGLDVQGLSDNELLANGLDSLSGQLDFLMGQKDAIEFNKSLNELKEELGILQYQEEAIKSLKTRVDFDQFESLKSEFDELQSIFNEGQASVLNYKERLKNWDKELEKFTMEHPTIKAMQDEFNEQKSIEHLFNDRSKGMQDLQSKEFVKSELMNQVGGSEEQVSQMISEKIAEANSQLATYKNKMNKLSEFPEINKEANNPLKGVPLKYRLVYSGNMNVNKGNPASLDINFNVAYRLFPKWSLGGGGVYRVNLGSAIDDIDLRSLGLGYRAFIDFEMFKSWFLEGAYEGYIGDKDGSIQNSNFELANKNQYETALIGLGYRYQISDKIKGKLMLFYDLLHNGNSPYNHPLQIRVGFDFN